ncbi:fungal-specific transcription factor domain-containing protein [Amylostereum chailletii]|nr:fungal-specific transcription factor domain-containing protein [Amylostereum chailletii]
MPQEPSAARQRASRRDQDGARADGTYAREIELKRSRGEISCAECRRLKIKCDKQIPCQSCQRRGCSALCPNGSLATGQGTRFVIAATEHLHRRIARMSDRIRQLEDALAVLQGSNSKDPHPLLRDSLLVLDQDKLEEAATESDDGEGPTDALNAFGTMSISDHGVSRFFGPTGGSEGLLLIDSDDFTASPKTDSSRSSNSPSLPSNITRFSHAFPFTPMGPTDTVYSHILSYLPPIDLALQICETYLQNAGWLFRGVSRQQLMDEMIPAIYKLRPAFPPEDYSGPHDLALLMSILSVGRIVDLTLSAATAEAEGEHYNQLAMAALCLQPVMEKPSMITIQMLHVASIYNAMSGSELSGGESSMETTWSLIALAAHLSQTIGLHRDSARWESSPKVVQRRRMLFWDLFVADAWHTLSTGRPPAFSRAYIDCQFPQDDEMKLNHEGKTEPGFGSWGFRFAFECVAEVAAKTLTASPPKYSEVLDLDRKIREFAIPAEALAMLRGGHEDPRQVPLAASMAHFVLSHTREVILLFVHRSFFAQALIEDPANPIRSQYAPSFLSTVRAASTILRSVRDQFALHPAMCSRFWSTWTYAFSAAVVFGVIVTRGPRSHLADTAMAELEQACDLFSQAGKFNRRAAKAYAILTRLRDKAHRALTAAQSREPPTPQAEGASWDIKKEDVDNDELNIFAGRTKVLRPTVSPLNPPCANPGGRPDPSPVSPLSTHALGGQYDGGPFSHGQQQHVKVGGWLAQQEQSTQYASGSKSQPPQHQHQHYLNAPGQFDHYPSGGSGSGGYHLSPGMRGESLHAHPQRGAHGHGYHVQPPAEPSHSSSMHLYAYDGHHAHHHHGQPGQGSQYGYGPGSELVQLGLAPSNRVAAENWTSFMTQTGILDAPGG